jgi:hypothetical protein
MSALRAIILAGHSLAIATASFLSPKVGGLPTEHEGDDGLGVGHGRGSPGNWGTDRGTPGSLRGRPEMKKRQAGMA